MVAVGKATSMMRGKHNGDRGRNLVGFVERKLETSECEALVIDASRLRLQVWMTPTHDSGASTSGAFCDRRRNRGGAPFETRLMEIKVGTVHFLDDVP